MNLDGIHHITAITGDAPRNVDFYTRVLGLRMTAKTVNQDDPTVYHLFYGDENAQPGADLTFFEYPGAMAGRPGAGMVHRVVWRVASREAIDFWAARIADEGLSTEGDQGRLLFADPEGLAHELTITARGDEPLRAEHPDIPQAYALQGFEGVRAYSAAPQHSFPVLEQLLGATPQGDATWELRGDRRGSFIAYDPPPADGQRPVQGAGSVHHVAWGTTQAEHPQWYEHLTQAGVPNSGIIDRHYFHSIYFREPSGVLFEIADDGPGFTVDVPLDQLGSKVILPPQLELHRAEIEAGLTPLPDPRAARVA
ncbi:MAG: VOC family protein [Actinobacteria bacterium]|nr:VOC family protein [Actinomycetota bacterium]